MATLSELFISDIQKQNSEPLSKSDAGWSTGAQLAQMKQQREMQMQQLQQKQQELQQAKLEKMHSFIADAKNYKNPSDRKNYLKAAIGYRNAMQIDPTVLPDETILSLGSDESKGRLATLDIMLKNEEITPQQYLTTVKDPQLFGKVQPTLEDATYDADPDKTIEKILDRKSAEKNAANKGTGTQGRADVANLIKITDKFNAATLKEKGRLTAATNIELLLKTKNPMSDSAVRTQLARLSGEVGPLSDFDVKTWSGDQSVLARTQQWLNLAAEGKLTEANRAQMSEVASTLRKVAQNRIKSEANRSVRLGRNSGIDEAELRDSLAIDEIIPAENESGGKTVKLSAGEFPVAQLEALGRKNKNNKFYKEYLKLKGKGQ